jgi:hypothetical protein
LQQLSRWNLILDTCYSNHHRRKTIVIYNVRHQ